MLAIVTFTIVNPVQIPAASVYFLTAIIYRDAI